MNNDLSAIRLVLMDIDGTLVSGSRPTFENVVRQLRRLRPVGIRFSVATGRTLYGCRPILDRLQSVGMRMPPIIAYNGAVVARPDETEVITRNEIPGPAFNELMLECRSSGLVLLAYACKSSFDLSPVETVYGETNLFFHPEVDFNGMPIHWVSDLRTVSDQDLTAVLATDPSGRTDLLAVTERLSQKFRGVLRITSSGGDYIEVAHPKSTKREAMGVLAGCWKVDPTEIMAIGDSFNDIDMLQEAGIGVAVANAPAVVKRVADMTCQLEASEGVVEAIRSLLTAKRLSHKLDKATEHGRTRNGR